MTKLVNRISSLLYLFMTISSATYPGEPTYMGVFKDGNHISNHNLGDLSQVPDVEYLIKIVYISYNLRKYTLIHPDGKLNFLKIGNFEVRDISNEFYHLDHKATITIQDLSENLLRKEVIITKQSADKMMTNLLELLNNLNEAGSYSIYIKLKELEELKLENSKLRNEILSFNSQIKVK